MEEFRETIDTCQSRIELRELYKGKKYAILQCKACNKYFARRDCYVRRSYKNNGLPIEHCSNKCAGVTKIGDKNNQWMGEDVSYNAIHDYIKYHKQKPEKCECCDKTTRLDLANISQKYKRDINDWEWLCRRCHMKKDGRLVKLIKRNKKQ